MILNRQRSVRVSIRALEPFLARAQRDLRFPSDSLAVCLVTNAQMALWNGAFRGKKGPTDVLSFPTEEKRGGKGRKAGGDKRIARAQKLRANRVARTDGFFSPSSPLYIGDIAIAPAVARRNARRLGRTLHDELRILILHGMLHLIGYDHETDNGKMERREKRLRRAFGIANHAR